LNLAALVTVVQCHALHTISHKNRANSRHHQDSDPSQLLAKQKALLQGLMIWILPPCFDYGKEAHFSAEMMSVYAICVSLESFPDLCSGAGLLVFTMQAKVQENGHRQAKILGKRQGPRRKYQSGEG
jgi:hypothetical protein